MADIRVALIAIPVLLAASAAAPRPGEGQQLLERRCGGCHLLDGMKEGPPLRGVFGRRAGSVAEFPYSDGLKNSGLQWDAPNLDKWLTDPESLVPDTDMAFRLENAGERSAIIAYLKSLSETGRQGAGR